MPISEKKPRVLIVTPEVTYLPDGMGNMANITAKAGGLADVSAALVSALFDQGGDVHIALPDYRSIFNSNIGSVLKKEFRAIRNSVPEERIHLAEDRAFYYVNHVYSSYGWENTKLSLAFQREVINNIVPAIRPDLIHCNDWMTGLIPAMARKYGIPCLFTIHNIFSVKDTLAGIEDRGIDAASFWKHLYFEHGPNNYEEAREFNPVDFLSSGVFAAHYVNTVSPTFLQEMIDGRHHFVKYPLQQELRNKSEAGCAVGVLNSPDPSYNPSTDKVLPRRYNEKDQAPAKRDNKLYLQQALGLMKDAKAPMFFWPSRLDTVQKGCQILAEILYEVVSRYWDKHIQFVFVANGEFQQYFNEIKWRFNLHDRVAVCGFDERLSRVTYGAADFVLMPSAFEPCGLPQMIGPIYGALPVAHDTGGIHDTIEHINIKEDTGNGFLFKTFDSGGLYWAIDQAMQFFSLPKRVKSHHIKRIMAHSKETFNHAVTARNYISLYEKMLRRPFIN